MALNILLEASPLENGVPTTKRMSLAAVLSDGVQVDQLEWLPVITTAPSLQFSVSEGSGQIGPMTVSMGSVSFRIGKRYANRDWNKLSWVGAPVALWIGETDKPFSSYRQFFTGTLSGMARTGNVAELALRTVEGQLDVPLLSKRYGGTGGPEGPAGKKGTFKPYCLGNARIVSPVEVDPARLVYQVHGYGPVADIPQVYEFAQPLEASKGDVATWDQLVAADLKPGEWMTCKALGMFRLGGRPDKKLTADVLGGSLDGTAPMTVAGIVSLLLQTAGVSPQRIGDMSALDFQWSFYATDTITVAEVVKQAALDASGYILADRKGVWQCGRHRAPKAPSDLRVDRTAEPLVQTINELNVTDPTWKVEVGYDRCWSVHSESDISPKLTELEGKIVAADEVLEDLKDQAGQAVADAAAVKAEIDEMLKDGILDRSDKRRVIDRLEAERVRHSKLSGVYAAYNVAQEWAAYDAAWKSVEAYVTGLVPSIYDNSANTPVDKSAYLAQWVQYEGALQSLLNALTGTVKKSADKAQETANQATDKADAAQDTADKAEGKADTVTKNLVGEKLAAVLQKQIDDIAALHITYGAGALGASTALAKKNLVAIRTLETRVEKDGSVVSEELLQLTSRLGKSESGLSEFRQTVANANYASVTSVDKMIAKYGEGVTAYQLAEKESYAADKSAFSKSLEEMGAKVVEEGKIREGKISELRNVILDENGNIRVEKISELGAKITEAVDGKLTVFEGAIKEVEKAYKDGDAIVAEKVDTLSSSITGPNGEIDKVKAIIEDAKKTSADLNNATAEDVKKLSTRLNDVGGATIEQAFKVVSDKVDGVSGAWTLKVQTDQNGEKYVAGIGLAVENGVSAFAVSADTFKLVTPGNNPKQLFYADASGVYMPDVRVDKLKAGAIDFEFLSRQSILNAASGYQALPGGLMLMWGQYRAYIAEERSISVNFPTVFPNACLSFTATPYITTASNARDLYIQVVGSAQQGSATVYTQGYKGTGVLDGFNWFAVGY